MLEDYKFLSDSFEEKKLDRPSLVLVAFKESDNLLLKNKIYEWFQIFPTIINSPDELFNFLNKNLQKSFLILNEDLLDEEFFRAIRVSGKKSEIFFFSSFNPNLENLKNSLDSLFSNQSLGLGITDKSPVMKEFIKKIKNFSKEKSAVLICGPTGSGKKTTAQAIHKLSPKAKDEMIHINLKVFGQSPSMIERELFPIRDGRMALGNYYLQNIENLPSIFRPRILNLLQNPIEGLRLFLGTSFDFSTFKKRDPEIHQLIGENILILPPLSQRKEDIPIIIEQFITKYSAIHNSKGTIIDEEALKALVEYSWPSNVLELENLIERLVILHGGVKIFKSDLPEKLIKDIENNYIYALPDAGLNLKIFLSDIESSLISQALSRCKGNKNKAAKLLGLNRTTLVEKLKKRSANS